MIPVRPTTVRAYLDMVLAPTDAEVDSALSALQEGAGNHLRALEASRRFSDALDPKAFDAAGRAFDHGLYTACRPYMVTAPTQKATGVVSTLVGAANEEALFSALEREFERVNGFRRREVGLPISRSPLDLSRYDSEWNQVRTDLHLARALRQAIREGRPYAIQAHDREPLGDNMVVLSQDTHMETIEGEALAQEYGVVLGSTFGRLAGLSEPTWWLGRNYWLGLLLTEDLGRLASWFSLPQFRFQKSLFNFGTSPAHLFVDVGAPGFEKGFPIVCEGYSTGLYFPPEVVRPFRSHLDQYASHAVALGARASGYEPSIVASIHSLVFEALHWAEAEGCGLLEGDELVGAYGER
jgi:hypothetical protein